MKIGDEVYIHGYVDEIRKDVVIIRNDGGYFGTDASEVILADCKDELQTDVVALDKATLMDYFINSVDENDEPVWTERHIDEILKDFDVVPKTKPQIKCDNCKTYWNCQGQCDEMPQIEDEPQKDNIKAIKDLQEYYGIKQEPMLSEMV